MSAFQFIFLLVSYLSGAIPFGYLLTRKATGLNILKLGSGNIGSTNVGRVAGRKVALQVQLLDMLKGLLPVAIVSMISQSETSVFPDYFIFLVAFSTIIGHNFSIFLRFRGGKGVNTTLGATVLLAPIEVFIAVAIYFLVKRALKFVSAGSMALALSLPVTGYFLKADRYLQIYLILCCIMIIARHIGNIRRLLTGNEQL